MKKTLVFLSVLIALTLILILGDDPEEAQNNGFGQEPVVTNDEHHQAVGRQPNVLAPVSVEKSYPSGSQPDSEVKKDDTKKVDELRKSLHRMLTKGKSIDSELHEILVAAEILDEKVESVNLKVELLEIISIVKTSKIKDIYNKDEGLIVFEIYQRAMELLSKAENESTIKRLIKFQTSLEAMLSYSVVPSKMKQYRYQAIEIFHEKEKHVADSGWLDQAIAEKYGQIDDFSAKPQELYYLKRCAEKGEVFCLDKLKTEERQSCDDLFAAIQIKKAWDTSKHGSKLFKYENFNLYSDQINRSEVDWYSKIFLEMQENNNVAYLRVFVSDVGKNALKALSLQQKGHYLCFFIDGAPVSCPKVMATLTASDYSLRLSLNQLQMIRGINERCGAE